MIDTAKLREIALAATPGPWRNEVESAGVHQGNLSENTWGKWINIALTDRLRVGREHDTVEQREANAVYIAAFNPEAALALLDALDAARAEVAALKDQGFDDCTASDACGHIREILDRPDIPCAAFIDDHVRNLLILYDNAKAEVASLLAQNQRLIALCELRGEALRPFADFADRRKLFPDKDVITQGSEYAKQQLTMGDCRRAREALEATS